MLITKRASFYITKMTFKIILSGVTGRIGKEVLDQAIRNPVITSVIALSRRPLPDLAQHDKVRVLLVQDFNGYSEHVVEEVAGADGCIWYYFY
jgi:dihydrodipicolinate reductase